MEDRSIGRACARCGSLTDGRVNSTYWLAEVSRYDGVSEICPGCSIDEAYITQSQGQQSYRVPIDLLDPRTGQIKWVTPPN